MKSKLIHFLNTYGNDFFHKLPKYCTAYHGNQCVKLVKFHPETLTFTIARNKDYQTEEIDLFELDEFCL